MLGLGSLRGSGVPVVALPLCALMGRRPHPNMLKALIVGNQHLKGYDGLNEHETQI